MLVISVLPRGLVKKDHHQPSPRTKKCQKATCCQTAILYFGVLMANRFKTTIRVKKKLWKDFRKDVETKGLSTCQVIEALISAFLYGGSMIPRLAQPLTLNLTMQHVVERHRRVQPKFET